MRTLRGQNVAAVIARLAPIERGWAAYYRTVVSSNAFHNLDDYRWKLTYKWAKFSHPNKPRHWIINRYFGQFNQARQDRWVFGDRVSGAYLPRFSWTKIVRHPMVAGTASPDDPALADYWADRRRRRRLPLDRSTLRLLQSQQGRCVLCGAYLLHADREPHSPGEWEVWLRATRKAIGRHSVVAEGRPGTPGATRLVHVPCQRRATGADADPAPLHHN